MYQRRYDKVYLMLRQEAAGYGLGGRAPWGSCVMELKNGKGRLTVQVQGLRPLPRAQYDVYALLATTKGQQTYVHCAALQIDAQGSGKMEWDFLPDDIANGYQAEDLFAVLITTTTQGKQIAPLAAYFGARREWRSCFTQDNMRGEEEKDLCAAEALPYMKNNTESFGNEISANAANVISLPSEKPKKVAQEATSEKTKEKTNEKSKEKNKEETQEKGNPKAQSQEVQTQPTESYHGNFRGLLQKFRDEMTQLQEMGILSEEESQRILGTKSTDNMPQSAKEPLQQTEQKLSDMQAAESSVPQPTQNTTTQNQQNTETIPHTQQTEQERTQARASALQQRIETPNTSQTQAPQIAQPQTTDTQQNQEISKSNQDWEILSQNQTLTPFEDGAPWHCISLGELVLLPQAPLAWQKDPFFLLSYARYGHLILRQNGEGYLIGLPDAYDSSERRRAEQLGFATFVRLPQQETLGYWIARL